MSKIVSIASAATDVQGVAGNSTLVGVAVKNNGASASTVNVRHGTSVAAPLIFSATVGAGLGDTFLLPAVQCPDGIFVDRDAVACELGLMLL